MSGLIHSLPFETTRSVKAPNKKDTPSTCRDRAAADLLRSVALITANERSILERSAASWELRAQLLDRAEETEQARAAAHVRKLSA